MFDTENILDTWHINWWYLIIIIIRLEFLYHCSGIASFLFHSKNGFIQPSKTTTYMQHTYTKQLQETTMKSHSQQ